MHYNRRNVVRVVGLGVDWPTRLDAIFNHEMRDNDCVGIGVGVTQLCLLAVCHKPSDIDVFSHATGTGNICR
jgi:hypothetical protein